MNNERERGLTHIQKGDVTIHARDKYRERSVIWQRSWLVARKPFTSREPGNTLRRDICGRRLRFRSRSVRVEYTSRVWSFNSIQFFLYQYWILYSAEKVWRKMFETYDCDGKYLWKYFWKYTVTFRRLISILTEFYIEKKRKKKRENILKLISFARDSMKIFVLLEKNVRSILMARKRSNFSTLPMNFFRPSMRNIFDPIHILKWTVKRIYNAVILRTLYNNN